MACTGEPLRNLARDSCVVSNPLPYYRQYAEEAELQQKLLWEKYTTQVEDLRKELKQHDERQVKEVTKQLAATSLDRESWQKQQEAGILAKLRKLGIIGGWWGSCAHFYGCWAQGIGIIGVGGSS